MALLVRENHWRCGCLRWNIKHLTAPAVTKAVVGRGTPRLVSLAQMASLSLARAFKRSVPSQRMFSPDMSKLHTAQSFRGRFCFISFLCHLSGILCSCTIVSGIFRICSLLMFSITLLYTEMCQQPLEGRTDIHAPVRIWPVFIHNKHRKKIILFILVNPIVSLKPQSSVRVPLCIPRPSEPADLTGRITSTRYLKAPPRLSHVLRVNLLSSVKTTDLWRTPIEQDGARLWAQEVLEEVGPQATLTEAERNLSGLLGVFL